MFFFDNFKHSIIPSGPVFSCLKLGERKKAEFPLCHVQGGHSQVKTKFPVFSRCLQFFPCVFKHKNNTF